jgi:hypothetical protein
MVLIASDFKPLNNEPAGVAQPSVAPSGVVMMILDGTW